MNAVGNAFDPFGAVVNGIHTGQIRQQSLRGTNIRRGFFAADMLLAGGQSHTQRRLAGSVFRHADDAAGCRAFEFIFKGKISRVRAAKAHRHAEALGVAECNIGTKFGGGFQQHQAHHIGRHRYNYTFFFQAADDALQIDHVAVFADILQQSTEIIAVSSGLNVADHQLETEIFGTGFHHVQRLRQHALINKELLGFRLTHTLGHRHRFGGGSGFVQQRRTGGIEAG